MSIHLAFILWAEAMMTSRCITRNYDNLWFLSLEIYIQKLVHINDCKVLAYYSDISTTQEPTQNTSRNLLLSIKLASTSAWAPT